MHDNTEYISVYRGELSAEQCDQLNKVLAHHDLPLASAYAVPDKVAFACLNCGTVGVAESNEARDAGVEHFDFTCCGLTVIFHSNARVLVDPTKLFGPGSVN